MPTANVRFWAGFSSGGEDALQCPVCGGGYLNQKRVEVFERTEDSVDGMHVKIENGSVSADRCMEGNPSGRRHGLTIYFECENCPSDISLNIYQHKGNTLIGFNY